MKLLTAALLAVLMCFVVACGGGGLTTPAVFVSGDSIHSGTFTRPDGTTGRLDAPPTARMNELAAGRFTVEDHAIPGMIAAEAVSGGFRWMEYGPNPPLADALKASPAQIVLFRHGTADALRGIGPEMFRANVRDFIRITRAAGKTPVLVEPIHQLPPFAAAADALQAVVLEVAATDGVKLIPVRDLSWELIDGIHPKQTTADRLDERIVEHVLLLLWP